MKNHDVFDLTATIEIAKNPEIVFKYLADYTNDCKWRQEINRVEINIGTVAPGSLIIEDSFLSRRVPHYISKLQCQEFWENHRIVSETIQENLFWAKNTRVVEPLPNKAIKVTYQLQFDQSIVKHGLGFQLPKILVKFYTLVTMKKYLRVLRKNLEI
ncbi:hypothetical protein HUW51_19235 [Adhaeribacter swui]|uniref:SRPBCC family protein n=1 Tax=Adhaeribacter swui TaxID=2086471 RepID=A0A7G7GC75_9BACT|nr:hypothetical protein [Adhaeribacter swui]QNF34759.1 hypothetical protein HUW51_19235 [Adhaeribacter swui]